MIGLELELDLAVAVSDGAEFMDAIDKGVPRAERWYWVVDPERLNMASGCRCIFGQHSQSTPFEPALYGLAYHKARAFGFDVPLYIPIDEGYRVLTRLWREAINDRRAADIERHEAAT